MSGEATRPPTADRKPPAVRSASPTIHIVIADEGWILERYAREIEGRLHYVTVGREPDPHAHGNYYVNYSAFRGRRSSLEIGFFTHVEERAPEAARRFFQVARDVDCCVCMSSLYADALRQAGIQNPRVITPGVELHRYRPLLRVGVVGRTYHTGRKGEELVRQVMDEPGIEWRFAGEGWPGPAERYSPEEMPAFYNSVDYVLIPAYYEGGPMSLLEALACGREVIAPPIGFVRDYPHIEFATGDAGDLRRVLRELLAKRESLRQAVAHRSWDGWAEQHDALFQELLSRRRSLPRHIPTVPPRRDTPARVLLATHSPESQAKGGPSIRVGKTAEALERLGLSVAVTGEDLPDATGFDLVHTFNVWAPGPALAQLRHLARFQVPIVFSPIYLDLSETSWASRAIPAIFRRSGSPEELRRYLAGVADGSLLVDGDSRFGRNEMEPGYFARLREMAGLAHHLIALSNHEMERLRATGVTPRPFTLVRNAADAGRFAGATGKPFAARYGLGDYVLCVGRLEPRKNQLMLAHALRETGLPLVLIGDRPDPVYAELVRRHAGPGVTFVERLPHDGDLLASAYAGARVFALPSWSEGAPLSALEAAAAGTALVLSDRSSEREYFGNLASYCDPGDPDGIRQAVLEAWESHAPDAHRREALRSLVRTEYSWERAARDTMRAYRQALQAFHSRDGGREAGSRGRDSRGEAGLAGPSRTVPPIRWGASLFDFSGYSSLCRQAIQALDRRGVPQSIEPFSSDERFMARLRPRELAFWRRLGAEQPRKGVYACFHPPTLWNGTDLFAAYRQRNPGFDAYVGITMFETDRLPAGWAEACNGMDELWVPSSFNRETFARSGVDPGRLRVVPFGIDARAYDPARVSPMPLPGCRGFVFLSVFQWNRRKGWDVLLKAYLTAFAPDEEVCLVLRSYPDHFETPPLAERIDRYVRQLGYDPGRIPPIVLLEDFVPEGQMPALYRAADAFVLPTRGEGWGLPFMEAMAMGLPTLGTRWSSHLDFMDDDNSFLIELEGLAAVDPEQTRENPFYAPDHRWAEPSVAHTAALMRQVYQRREEARARGARARRDIQERCSMERTADWIAERAAALAATRSAPRTAPSRRPAPPAEPAGERPRAPALLWHAPLFDPSGYADEARQFVLGLDALGVPIRAVPLAWSEADADLPAAELARLRGLTRTRFEPSLGPPASVFHIFPPHFRRVPEAAYHVGRTMFETDRIPQEWVQACNGMDELWVPSDFNLDSFARSGVQREKLVKMPGAIDPTPFRLEGPALPIQGRRGFNFLSVFDWQARKGWDLLLRAFLEEFHPEEEVALILKVWSSFGHPAPQLQAQAAAFLRSAGLARGIPPNLLFCQDSLPAYRLPELYRAADAFVLPTRGEGWGRPFMEAMLMGLPTIGTRCSGQLEFMNDANAYLIDCRLQEVPPPAWQEVPAFRGHRWAEPSLEHLRRLMRRVFEGRQEARQRGEAARRHILAGFTRERVAERVAERLAAVRERARAGETAAESQRLWAVPPDTPRRPLAISWEGSQFVHHSLALVNRELCLRLLDSGQELSLIPYEPDRFDPRQDPRLHRLAARVRAPLSRPADIHVRHQWPPDLTPPPDGRWVMIQPWEFGSLPRQWAEVMSRAVDEVWVPTSFVRECYIQSGVPADRVQVVPNGVDTRGFRPEAPPLLLETHKRVRFLFVGGTIWRKGPDVLLDAYLAAFTARDDVCLVIKDVGGSSFYSGQTAVQRVREIQADPDAPEILYLDQEMSPADLPGLYTACHCLVHPYRGEGFGLPIAEAMACGLPVIVTGEGACLDFCDETVAYLIPARRRQLPEKRIDRWETVGYPFLYEPDLEATARLMRRVLEHPEEARARGRRAAERIREAFTWERTAERVLERMRALLSQPARRVEPRPRPLAAVLAGEPDPRGGMWTSLVSHTPRPLSILARATRPEGGAGHRRPEPALPEGWRRESADLPLPRLLNRALRDAEGAVVLLLSPDLVLTEGWLERMLAVLDREPEVAIVGPASHRAPAPQRVKASYAGTGKELRRFAAHHARRHAGEWRAVPYLGGFCLAFRSDACRALGPLREELDAPSALWEYFARVRQSGRKVALAVDAYVHHETLSEEEGGGYDDLAAAERAVEGALSEGRAALERGDLVEAAHQFGAVVQQLPDLAAAHAALGSTLMALERFQEAVPSLRRAVDLTSGEASLRNQLGVALFQTGDLEGAEAAFRAALGGDAGDVRPALNLIDLYRATDRYPEATQAVKEALDAHPQDPDVLAAFGTLSLELGDREGAALALEHLLRSRPDHPDAEPLRRALAQQEIAAASPAASGGEG